MFPTLKTLFRNVCEDFEAELVEFNGEEDYMHLLVNYPPKIALSKQVNSLKGVSSRKNTHHQQQAQPTDQHGKKPDSMFIVLLEMLKNGFCFRQLIIAFVQPTL